MKRTKKQIKADCIGYAIEYRSNLNPVKAELGREALRNINDGLDPVAAIGMMGAKWIIKSRKHPGDVAELTGKPKLDAYLDAYLREALKGIHVPPARK